MSLPESLERAASELAPLADRIRPANGDPHRLLEELDAEQAASLLAWILRHEPDSADELVEAWSESETGTRVLLAQSDEGLPKSARKLLRRAHHRLRSQGLTLPAASTSISQPVRRVVGGEDRWQAAYVSVPDFRGSRMGYLADSNPSVGARLFEIRFDPGRGIMDFKVYNAGRSKVRGFLRSLASSPGDSPKLFEVDHTALCALIRQASRGQPDDRPLPTAFVEWRGRLFPESLEKEATPGEQAREALREIAPSEAPWAFILSEVEAGRLGPWPPGMGWISEWMQKGRETVASVGAEEQESALESWLAQATSALAEQEPTSVALIARHLEEMAWLRWQQEKTTEARDLIAAADELSGREEAWRELARVRVEALFGPLIEELRATENEPDERDGRG